MSINKSAVLAGAKDTMVGWLNQAQNKGEEVVSGLTGAAAPIKVGVNHSVDVNGIIQQIVKHFKDNPRATRAAVGGAAALPVGLAAGGLLGKGSFGRTVGAGAAATMAGAALNAYSPEIQEYGGKALSALSGAGGKLVDGVKGIFTKDGSMNLIEKVAFNRELKAAYETGLEHGMVKEANSQEEGYGPRISFDAPSDAFAKKHAPGPLASRDIITDPKTIDRLAPTNSQRLMALLDKYKVEAGSTLGGSLLGMTGYRALGGEGAGGTLAAGVTGGGLGLAAQQAYKHRDAIGGALSALLAKYRGSADVG